MPYKSLETDRGDSLDVHPTFWNKHILYIAHYYDLKVDEDVKLRICEELFEEPEEIKYGYFKAWDEHSKMLIHHRYQQPREFRTKRFRKSLEIVGARK